MNSFHKISPEILVIVPRWYSNVLAGADGLLACKFVSHAILLTFHSVQ